MDSKPNFLDGEGSFFSRSPARLEKKLQKIFALVFESKDSFSLSLRHVFVSETQIVRENYTLCDEEKENAE